MGLKGLPILASVADSGSDRNFGALSVALAKVFVELLLGGALVTSQAIVAGTPLQVPHGLGRAPRGWIVVRRRANANVWDSQDSNQTPERTLVLNASANVTVDLYVF